MGVLKKIVCLSNLDLVAGVLVIRFCILLLLLQAVV